MYSEKMIRDNRNIIREVTYFIDKLPEANFVALWNFYSKQSDGPKEQRITRKRQLNYMDGYTMDDCLFALAQDICIDYNRQYKKKTFNGKPILPVEIEDIIKRYSKVDVDEEINSMARAFKN